MLPVLQLGPLSLPVQPFLLLLGILLGMWASEKFVPSHGIDASRLSNLVTLAFGAGLLGARMGFVLRHSAAFASNPLSVFALSLQMLDLDAGLLVGVLAAIVYAQKFSLPAWQLLDAFTPALAIFAVTFWLGAFASGDAYGAPTSLPWAIPLWGAMRHPTQLYAVAGAALAAWLSWPRAAAARIPGLQFLTFCAWSATYLMINEAWRGDPTTHLFGAVRSGQVFAWLLLGASLYLFGRRKRSAQQKH
ncbi:MAG TPA: prolipoprotein diacylglyceryl transferase family protein [Anaerolineaceae bacterium]|nr:prolipoprotein diacylglyceryl transferase family protein [Anaerolineaceae bacterium]